MNHEVRHLFHELADLSPEDRGRVFQERKVAPEVRAEIESLLSFDSTNPHQLTDCVSDAAEQVLSSVVRPEPVYCGPYRLIRPLGSGGMGAVYLAERTDGEMQQTVAIKLLRADEHRAAWRDRFLQERQLLARMNHPSIVHAIDAGHTEDGRPYLVMEYVDGTPIDAYASGIELREQLALFLRVCAGLSHAHGRLIIHRDLKPSNILVDASGQPKLLDFGIAKLLDDTGDATQTMERLLTPNYASPEQLQGTAQTTASDVYSLGAVLHKLLTGQSPRESREGTARAIQGPTEITARRALHPHLPIDLDYVLRKALRLEPEERYASVEAFAGDIRAFLESRPVQARSGNAWYRTRKFLRRYWAPVAGAAVVIASLSAGLYVANRQRMIAEQRFQQLRGLSNEVFDLDMVMRDLPGSAQARQRLVAASLNYLEVLETSVRGNMDLTREVGEGYWRLGRIQGVPVGLNLGQRANAEASLKKADALIDAVLSAKSDDARALFRSGSIAQDRMILAQEERRNVDAVAYARKSAARIEAFLKTGQMREDQSSAVAGSFANLALGYLNMHRYDEAISAARRSIEVARPVPSARIKASQGFSLLASALRYQGDLGGALQAIRRARQIASQASYSSETLRMIELYGIVLREGEILGEDGGINLGRPDEAVVSFQEAFDMTDQAARRDPGDATSRSRVGTSGRRLAAILRHRDPQRALAIEDIAISCLAEVPKSLPARRSQAMALAGSSYSLRALRRPAEARQRIDSAVKILGETKDYPADRVPLDSPAFAVLCAQADQEAADGDPHRAVEQYEQLLDKVMAAKPEPLADLRDAPAMSRLYEGLARACRRTGDNTKAESAASRRLELWRHWDSKLPQNSFVRSQMEAANHP
jgi:tetratricopeptide (TPR) repeat protein